MTADMKKLIALVENETPTPLQGTANVRQLMAVLPEIDNPQRFMIAFNKVRRGREDTLNRLEIEQLAKAFVGLMKDDRTDKMKVLRHMASLHATGEQKDV